MNVSSLACELAHIWEHTREQQRAKKAKRSVGAESGKKPLTVTIAASPLKCAPAPLALNPKREPAGRLCHLRCTTLNFSRLLDWWLTMLISNLFSTQIHQRCSIETARKPERRILKYLTKFFKFVRSQFVSFFANLNHHCSLLRSRY